MTTSMTCDEFSDTLADFLEGDVDDGTGATVEAHALRCAGCGALLADLRELRLSASHLPELEPSRDLWDGIAQRIETPVVALGTGLAGPPARRRAPGLWYGLAAAGLIAVTATVTHELTKRSVARQSSVRVASTVVVPRDTGGVAVQPPAATTPETQATPQSPGRPRASLASRRPSPEQTYDQEIRRLKEIVSGRRSSLDSSTVAVIDQNLKVIDNAIAQCRQALKKDPASRFLIESLNDAIDNKVQLLRTAALLPSKT